MEDESVKLMTDPVVSIVMPAYNAEAYIVDSIKSALNQSFHELEVIVVDDASTDKTAHLVKQLDDPRIRLVSQNNRGQSVAINNGVECASGTYIKLLDADDWLNPTHVESQLEAINGTQGMLASCRWGYFVNDYNKPAVREECTNKSYDDPFDWLVDSLSKDEGMMGGWMWLIPRSVWQKAGGFDPRLSLNNDFHFSIKLLLASDGIRYAKDAIYRYRKGTNNALSGRQGRAAMESAFMTTKLGTEQLLERENSLRIRKVCADRFQQWSFLFYPSYPDLFSKTEKIIHDLGGSDFNMKGGRAMQLMLPLIGWKSVRQLQRSVYKLGWKYILQYKAKCRLKSLN